VISLLRGPVKLHLWPRTSPGRPTRGCDQPSSLFLAHAVLLDLHMPFLDGTTRRLTAHHPVAVVVLTTYADDSSVLAALQAGARSYLTKEADRAEIAQALRGAATGLSVLDPAVRDALLAAATRGTPRFEVPREFCEAPSPPPSALSYRLSGLAGLAGAFGVVDLHER
jgi:DNA-binding NarL/FixJ family response regulator